MNNLVLALVFFIFSSFGFLNVGAHFATKKVIYETTVECIENQEKCKQRYKYFKLREKLGEN